jgi:hypothetical protein
VNWFNAVDETYRSDLRELNELNFARFDAKLEQRVAVLDAKWDQRWTQLDAKWEQRSAETDAKITGLGDAIRKELAAGLGELHGSLLKWMFGFWATTVLGVLGTGIAVVSLLLRR